MNTLASSMLSIDFNHMEENLKAVRDAGATYKTYAALGKAGS